MKISELMVELTTILARVGDIPVVCRGCEIVNPEIEWIRSIGSTAGKQLNLNYIEPED